MSVPGLSPLAHFNTEPENKVAVWPWKQELPHLQRPVSQREIFAHHTHLTVKAQMGEIELLKVNYRTWIASAWRVLRHRKTMDILGSTSQIHLKSVEEEDGSRWLTGTRTGYPSKSSPEKNSVSLENSLGAINSFSLGPQRSTKFGGGVKSPSRPLEFMVQDIKIRPIFFTPNTRVRQKSQ